jgi:hypothetical protein
MDQSDELEKTPTKKGPADAGPFLVAVILSSSD